VKSKDAAGNLQTSADFTFTTLAPPDTTAPVINAVSASGITSAASTITWTTNEASDTQVEYGLTTAYGFSTTLNPTLVTSHSQALSGLTANSLYHYRVKSKDAAGNLQTSADFTFTTSPTTPSIDSFPSVTNQNSLVLSGSKQANTSILIDGVEASALDAKTVWYAVVLLSTEGQHVFHVTSKNNIGSESNVATIAIELDKTAPSPPVLSPTTVLETNHKIQTIMEQRRLALRSF
jgi:hypothetical protein